MKEEKNEEINLEIKDKIYNSQTDKLKENKKNEIKHKKLDLYLEKNEEGKINDSDLSSTPNSNLKDKNPNPKINNTMKSSQTDNMNMNINNKNRNYRIKKDNNTMNNNEINKIVKK